MGMRPDGGDDFVFFAYSMHSWERRARGRVGGDVSMRVRGVAGRRRRERTLVE